MSKWVSVKDKLPEFLGLYLGHRKNGFVGLFAINAIGQWSLFGSRDKDKIYKKNLITHWQPLPKPPPKEE